MSTATISWRKTVLKAQPTESRCNQKNAIAEDDVEPSDSRQRSNRRPRPHDDKAASSGCGKDHGASFVGRRCCFGRRGVMALASHSREADGLAVALCVLSMNLRTTLAGLFSRNRSDPTFRFEWQVSLVVKAATVWNEGKLLTPANWRLAIVGLASRLISCRKTVSFPRSNRNTKSSTTTLRFPGKSKTKVLAIGVWFFIVWDLVSTSKSDVSECRRK